MGYTTAFEGEFHLYRAETPQLAVFLRAAREDEGGAREALADWLIDQGDPRGEEAARLLRQADLDEMAFWRLFGLRPEHADYLRAFCNTRRMKRDPSRAERMPDPVREAAGLPIGQEGAYFVGGQGCKGQRRDESVLEDRPPEGQPGLWCQWTPSADGIFLAWDGGEKFYDYVAWLVYLLEHFLGPWGYVVNGVVTWQGEEGSDRGAIVVTDNKVEAKRQGRARG
jgi:hypothetical protein